MDNILPSNETTEFENRLYLNPNLVVDETSNFIDKYRNIQNTNNQQIKQQTANLGTNVPTNLGGLTGSQNYWTSRYQVPNTASTVANLRATAQATALNEVLANEKAKWQKRYNDAYRAYQKRQYDASKTPATNPDGTIEGGEKKIDNGIPVDKAYELEVHGGQTAIMEPDSDTGGTTGRMYYIDENGQGHWVDTNVTYSHDVGRGAGVEQLSDIFTGMYNYTIPVEGVGNLELELGGWDENLVKGSNGKYYIWNKKDNTYTQVTGESGRTEGGTRWWKK